MADTVRLIVEVDVSDIEAEQYGTPEAAALKVALDDYAETDNGIRVLDVELLA